MRIEAWSDVVCPWCAVGKAHLGQALARFEHAAEVDLVWRSFELDPGAPAVREGAYDALLAAKYGTSPAGGKAMVGRLAEGAVLSDLPTLQRLSQEAGLDAGDVERVLSGDAFAGEVRADEAEAGRREVTAVPTFLVDGLIVIPGAQSPDSMLATLRRAWARRSAA